MISRIVAIERWRASISMGFVINDGGSRSSERRIWPGWEFGEPGLLPKRRVVDCDGRCRRRLMLRIDEQKPASEYHLLGSGRS